MKSAKNFNDSEYYVNSKKDEEINIKDYNRTEKGKD